jgi:hypothetical protein
VFSAHRNGLLWIHKPFLAVLSISRHISKFTHTSRSLSLLQQRQTRCIVFYEERDFSALVYSLPNMGRNRIRQWLFMRPGLHAAQVRHKSPGPCSGWDIKSPSRHTSGSSCSTRFLVRPGPNRRKFSIHTRPNYRRPPAQSQSSSFAKNSHRYIDAWLISLLRHQGEASLHFPGRFRCKLRTISPE